MERGNQESQLPMSSASSLDSERGRSRGNLLAKSNNPGALAGETKGAAEDVREEKLGVLLTEFWPIA